jgi:hypothetical protein
MLHDHHHTGAIALPDAGRCATGVLSGSAALHNFRSDAEKQHWTLRKFRSDTRIAGNTQMPEAEFTRFGLPLKGGSTSLPPCWAVRKPCHCCTFSSGQLEFYGFHSKLFTVCAKPLLT